jgi:hypothetical protein
VKKKGAHITLIFSKGKMSGVQNKIKQFSPAFNSQNFDVIVLNREMDGLIDGINYINYEKKYPGWSSRLMRYFLIANLVDLQQYDRIIIRYPLFDFSYIFIARYFRKIYFEGRDQQHV